MISGDIICHTALARKVLCVAVYRATGVDNKIAWAAYVDAVRGWDHEAEAPDVASRGHKLTEDLARAIFKSFPELMDGTYWR